MKKHILTIFLIITGLQIVQAQDDPFIGHFENKSEEFSLKINKTNYLLREQKYWA